MHFVLLNRTSYVTNHNHLSIVSRCMRYGLTAYLAMLLTGCAVQVKPEAQHVRVITQEQTANCEFIKVINTYDVALKLFGDSEAEGAQNMAKNRVAEVGGNAMRILSINNQEVKDKNKTYVTVEAYKCPRFGSITNQNTNAYSREAGAVSTHKTDNEPAGIHEPTTSLSIKEAQAALSKLGYSPGIADGVMGNKTATAIKQFQTDNRLKITGMLDAETATLLRQKGRHTTERSNLEGDTNPKPPSEAKPSGPQQQLSPNKSATDL